MRLDISNLNNYRLPIIYTCDGRGLSPEIKISEVPPRGKSLVLTIDDPDAPSGTYDHWTVWNIPPSTNTIASGEIPSGAVVGLSSANTNKYVPPCPPSGEHRYIFKVYALDTTLDLPAASEKTAVLAAITGHIVDQAQLVTYYSRK